jgi:hypothetical protein
MIVDISSKSSCQEDIVKTFKQINEFICNKVKETEEFGLGLINSSNNFDELAKQMGILKSLVETLNNFFQNIDNIYDNLKEKLSNNFNEKHKEADFIINKEILDDEDYNKLYEINEYFSLALHNENLRKHLDSYDIKKKHENFLDRVSDYFKSIKDEVSELIYIMTKGIENKHAANNRLSFGQIENEFYKMKQLRKVPDFEQKTQNDYNSILESLTKLINRITTNIDEVFSSLNSNDAHQKINFTRFFNNIRVIKELKWIEKFKKNVYYFSTNEIKNNLIDFVDLKLNELKGVNFTFENLKNVQHACAIYNVIAEFKPLTASFSELSTEIGQVEDIFMSKLKNELNTFIQALKSCDEKTGVDYEYTKNFICFIDCVEKANIVSLPNEFSAAKTLIKTVLSNHLNKSKTNLDTALEEIKSLNEDLKKNCKTFNLILGKFHYYELFFN